MAHSTLRACAAVESWPVEPRGQPRPDVVSRWLVDPITRQLSVRIPRQLIVSHRHADLASGNPCSEAGRARRRGGRSAGGMMPDLSEMPEMPGVEPQDDGDDIYEAERSPARTTRVPSRGEPAGAAVSAPRRTKSPHDGGYSTAAKPPVSPAVAASSGGSRAPSAPAPAPAPPPSGGAVAIDPPAARTVRPPSAQTWKLWMACASVRRDELRLTGVVCTGGA